MKLLATIVMLSFAAIVSSSCEEARVQVSLEKDSLLTRDMVTVTLGDGESNWRFGPAQFSQDPDAVGFWSTPEVETKKSGTLTVRFEIRDDRGRLQASGSLFNELKSDWRWNYALRRDKNNPALYCFGCFGSRAYAFADTSLVEPGDSLFVTWGGNYISHPVIY